MRLAGKVAVVTGAARGIGRAIAARYVAEGARVVIGDVADRPADLGADPRLHYLQCDIGDAGQARQLVQAAVDRYGRLDICVNNAGILGSAPFLETTPEQFDEVIRVNLRGHFLVGQASARQMVAQNAGGAIINMSSINSVVASFGQTAYAASKGAIQMLTKSMAVQLAEYGIRVNAIGPGTIATEMAIPHIGQALLSRIPLGRAGEPAEVGSIAVFLATDDASYVTGETIYVDGGRLALNLPKS